MCLAVLLTATVSDDRGRAFHKPDAWELQVCHKTLVSTTARAATRHADMRTPPRSFGSWHIYAPQRWRTAEWIPRRREMPVARPR
eukprot:10773979-Alexandrium_andersonii.AAC.1